MVILQGLTVRPRFLVFEATFDGLREEFFDDLLRVASRGDTQGLWKLCRLSRILGYPSEGETSGTRAGQGIFGQMRCWCKTFYSGSPGRSVAQIRGEQQIRDEIARFISKRRRSIGPPTSFQGFQRELEREVIRNRPRNRWAEQSAAVPWEVAQGPTRVKLALLLGFATAFIIGWLVPYIIGWLVPGVSGAALHQKIASSFQGVANFSHRLNNVRSLFPDWLKYLRSLLDTLRLPNHVILILPIALWFVLRLVEFWLEY